MSLTPDPGIIKSTVAIDVGSSVDGPGLTVNDVFRTLKSHAGFIAACTLAGLIACLLYMLLHHPVYKSSAVIRIDPSRVNNLAVGAQQNGAPVDESSVIQTEVGVLQSNRVALRALSSLTQQDFQRVTGAAASQSFPVARETALTKQDALTLADFEEDLKIMPQTGTELIDVSYSNRDPALAARVSNSVVAAYTSESLSSRKDSVAQLRLALAQEIQGLREQVDRAQDKLSKFQEANNILDTQTASNTTLDKLRLLSDRLGQAQADRIVKQAAFQAAKSSTPESLASLYPNANLSELEIQQAQLNTTYAHLAAKFDSQYPPLVEVKKQIAFVTQRLAESTQSVQNRLRQESDAALLVERDLQNQYDAQLASAYKLNRSQADYAVLQSEVTSGRDLLNALQTKMQQAVLNAEVTGANIVVVDDASVPSAPSGPKKSVLLGSSALIGFLVGSILSLFFEGASRKIRLVADAERFTGIPVLGVIPDRWNTSRFDAHDEYGVPAIESADLSSIGAGPYRELRDRLLLSLPQEVVLVAGATPEVKTGVTALQIAAALSKASYKVLVVDAGNSARACENQFGTNTLLPHAQGTGGIARPLSGLTGVSFVSMASASVPIADQIASETFTKSMATWATEYDMVLVSTGPLLAAENLLLARRIGSALLVVQYGSARTDAIAKLRRTLSDIGATVPGMILTGVPNVSKEAVHVPSNS